MIVFGTPNVYQTIQNKFDVVYNFNSLMEGVTRLDALNPYWTINTRVFTDEYSFDKWFVEYLTTTSEAFKQMIDLLRIVYNGYNVYVMCDFSNEVSVNMIECLIKFITDTYGYACNIAKDVDDIATLREGTFSADGVQLFDENMNTYIKMFGIRGLASQHGDLA